MIGYSIPGEKSLIVDQACIFGVVYLLAENGHEYSIYQISDLYNIVPLSSKKLRKLRKYLSNRYKWRKQTYIPIDSNGELIQAEITGRDLPKKAFISAS
jgi:hypothetical protein